MIAARKVSCADGPLSISKVKCFAACPVDYYFLKILKIIRDMIFLANVIYHTFINKAMISCLFIFDVQSQNLRG